MRKSILIATLAAALTFLLASCSGDCNTKECYEARSAYEAQQSKIRQEQADAEHRRYIEAKKAEAEIEAKKPESVRVQEAKNKEPSATDGIGQAAGWAAGAYVIGKVLESAR